MSLPEVLLWQQLGEEPHGVQLRRQHPAGPYVIDFYCATANLALEIDGEAHNYGDRPARDEWLNEQGVRTLRIPAVEVLKNLDGVLQAISAVLRVE